MTGQMETGESCVSDAWEIGHNFGRVHVQTSCVKPRFRNLDFERKKYFNKLDYTMEACIYLNNRF